MPALHGYSGGYMIKKVVRYMREHEMTAPGDSVIVGVSGGADSVCLLYILWSLREELGIEQIGRAHV